MGSAREDHLVKVALKNGLVNPRQLMDVMRELGERRRGGDPTCTLAELLAQKGLVNFERAGALLQHESYRDKSSAPENSVATMAVAEERQTAENGVAVESVDALENWAMEDGAEDDPGSTQRREKLARFEEYRIIRRLGSDALGVTYQAVYIPDHARVILRILNKQKALEDPKAAGEFLAVLKRAHKLDHSGIQKILRGARRHNRLFYAAEYLTGNSLRKVLKERGRLETGETLDIAVQVTRALEYAHNKKIFHTQLDPSKLILDTDGRVRLVGFGLGGDVVRNLEWLAGALGDMPYYVAPEMVTGGLGENLIGPGTDIYSLGAILFHCLTGVPPFMGNSLDEVLLDMYQSETLYERLNSVQGIPADLRALLQRMLTPEPGRRIRSASELLRNLLSLQAQEAREVKGRGQTRKTTVAGAACSAMKAGGKKNTRLRSSVKNRMLLKKIKDTAGTEVADRSNIKLLAGVALVLGAVVYLVVHGLSSRSEMQAKMILQRQEIQQQEHLDQLQKALKAVPPTSSSDTGTGGTTKAQP